MRAVAAPMTARSTRCSASAPIEAPTSSTINSPRKVGHSAAIAGRSIPASILRSNFDIAISAPVLPAETTRSASPLLHRIDREPHGGLAAAVAQRLARLVLHPHRDFGMHDSRGRLQRPALGDERRESARRCRKKGIRFRGCRAKASSAPATTTAGPWSLPSHREQCGPFAP